MIDGNGRFVYWATTTEHQGRMAVQVAATPEMYAATMIAARSVADDLNMEDIKITCWCHHGHQPDEPCTNVPQDITATADADGCGRRCAYFDLLELERLRSG